MRCLRSSAGLTLVELLVALVLLASGVLLVAGAAGTAGRLLADGRRASRAGRLAERRLELLRGDAARAGSGCALASGRDSAADGVALTWQLGDLGPALRRVALVITRPTPTGPRADTVVSWVTCD